MDLKNKKVTVAGLGLHGGALGNIEWLYEQGAILTVTDLKTEEELAKTVEKLKKFPELTLILGKHRDEDFTKADLVLRNPAVPRTSKYLKLAQAAGVPIEMDSSLFFEFCPSTNIIGVTGSKGKTTTASAIAALLKANYPQTVAVGVDGVSPLGELKSIQPDSPVVFELSSWRLEPLDERKISPPVGVVTSLFRDHLNTYSSFEEYIEIKKVLVKYQNKDGVAILNSDDERLRSWKNDLPGKILWYGLEDRGAEGIFVRDSRIYTRLNGAEQEVCALKDVPFESAHEQRNMLPAILIARLHQISIPDIKTELARLTPLPHRLEIVRQLSGVKYINDSAATMPDATIAALKAMQGKPLVHILGGSDKALLFEELAEEEKKAAIRALIFLPGTATERMQKEILEGFGEKPAVYTVKTMPEAVQKAREVAQAGDTVLLSPGATSFGLFQHEFDRGDQFRALVRAL